MSRQAGRSSREPGIDIARGTAVIGMVAVNYGLIFSNASVQSPQPDVWSKVLTIPAGDASATFVLLAGLSIGLRMLQASTTSDGVSRERAAVAKRALCLLVLGAIHFLVWPPDILHLYGLMMIVTIPVLRASPRLLVSLATVVVLGYVVLLDTLDYETGWNFATLTYTAGSFAGHARRALVNGFHPVIPWVAFLWIGLALSRRRLDEGATAIRLLVAGGAVAIAATMTSRLAVSRIADPDLVAILGTESLPPGPLYMIQAAGTAVAILGGSILVARSPRLQAPLSWLGALGRLSLSVYVAHIVVGVALLIVIPEGLAPAWVAVLATVAFCGAAAMFASWLDRRGARGPLEQLVRRVAGPRP